MKTQPQPFPDIPQEEGKITVIPWDERIGMTAMLGRSCLLYPLTLSPLFLVNLRIWSWQQTRVPTFSDTV